MYICSSLFIILNAKVKYQSTCPTGADVGVSIQYKPPFYSASLTPF